MLKPAYTEKSAFVTFVIPILTVQMRIYNDVDCRSQNGFSENEYYKHQLAEKFKLLHFTAKLSVLSDVN